jgi:hypothetical protein
MKPNYNNNKQPARTKPVIKNVSFIASGKDRFGNNYNAESANSIMAELQECNVFSKLSVSACMPKSQCLKKDIKGTMNVARILSYDAESGNVELLFFGKNVEYAKFEDDTMALVPHVRIDRNNGDVSTIAAFEIVPIMEA